MWQYFQLEKTKRTTSRCADEENLEFLQVINIPNVKFASPSRVINSAGSIHYRSSELNEALWESSGELFKSSIKFLNILFKRCLRTMIDEIYLSHNKHSQVSDFRAKS